MAAGLHPKKLGQGIADQIALACRVSPWEGSRRLNIANTLWFDLPQTYGLLITSELRERIAEQVVTATRHLDAGQRRTVDDGAEAPAGVVAARAGHGWPG